MINTSNIYNKNNWQLLLLLIVVILWAISFYNRLPNEDEAVIAGHSYFFNELGYVKSDLYGGYGYDWENRQFFYHKLFVLTGSLFSNLFGFNIYVFKSISAFFSLFLFLFLFLYIKDFYPSFSTKKLFFLSVALLLWNSIFFDLSFMYRPEVMVSTLGFISYYFLKKGLKERYFLFMILSGSFAGLSVFAHLNGIIFCVAGAVFLVLKRQFHYSFLFSIFAIAFGFLYFFDISTIDEFNRLTEQLSTDPNVVDAEGPFILLIKEQMRFFHSPKEASFSVLFLLSVILFYKKLKKFNSDILLYLVILIVTLGMLAHGKTTKYATNYYPFMVLVVSTTLMSVSLYSGLLRKVIVSFTILFFVVQGIYNLKLFNERINLKPRVEYLSGLLPENNVKISAPSVFAFNQIYNYTIRGEIAFDHHYSAFYPNESRTTGKYFRFAYENGDKYILIDRMLNTRDFALNPKLDTVAIEQEIYNYRLIEKKEDVFVFQRVEESSVVTP